MPDAARSASNDMSVPVSASTRAENRSVCSEPDGQTAQCDSIAASSDCDPQQCTMVSAVGVLSRPFQVEQGQSRLLGRSEHARCSVRPVRSRTPSREHMVLSRFLSGQCAVVPRTPCVNRRARVEPLVHEGRTAAGVGLAQHRDRPPPRSSWTRRPGPQHAHR